MNNIHVTAYSSFGAASYVEMGMADKSNSLLENQTIKEIGEKIGKSPG